jgi:hypothetical protein
MFAGLAGLGLVQAIAAQDAESIAYTGRSPNPVIFGIMRAGPGFIPVKFKP